MASPVVCPVCGADGTIAANAIIAQSTQPQPAVATGAVVRLHIATPAATIPPPLSAPAPNRGPLLAGQLDPAKAETEARSKIFWGDPPEDAVKFLMMHGFSHEDALVSVRAMFQERLTALRGIGIRKIMTGIALMAVPVVVLLIFAHFHVIIITVFALAVMLGLWGGWMFLKGLMMVFTPKSETGDVADQ
jgi:hypothetical protein